MPNDYLSTTHRQLGELAVMQAQTERAERDILKRAEDLLAEQQKLAEDLRSGALAGEPDAMRRYQDCIAEQGRLKLVIAQAREVLAG